MAKAVEMGTSMPSASPDSCASWLWSSCPVGQGSALVIVAVVVSCGPGLCPGW